MNNMKKIYDTPEVELVALDAENLLSSSPDLKVVEVEEGEYEGRAKEFNKGFEFGNDDWNMSR